MFIKEFTENSFVHESVLCGYMWSNPNLYQKYKNHKIVRSTFTESVWFFYFNLGFEMYNEGIRDFDDVTVYTYVSAKPKEVGKKSYIDSYNDFGGYETIQELMEACHSDNQNDEYHFNEVQKYETLRKMQHEGLINKDDNELIKKFTRMNLTQLHTYMNLKTKELFAHINSGEVIEHDLAGFMTETIEEMDAGDVMGTPLHDAPRLNSKIKGWKNGALYYLVLSSGVGKSSFTMEKFILSLFDAQEKGILAINEESVKKWRQLLLATVSNKKLKVKINREKMYKGNFDEQMLNKLNNAKDWIESNGSGLIKTLELKKYRLEDIINRVELYKPRGFNKLIIDTFKPDRSNLDKARWEAFSNSAQELHECIKEDNNNVGTLATVQLKLGKETRYLDLDAIGKSMEIVEVAAVVMMGRLLFEDEYDPKGKFGLNPYNWEKDEISGTYFEKPYELDKKKEYLIIFLSKNRHGSEDEQIIFEANYSINEFKEVALVKVPRYGE